MPAVPAGPGGRGHRRPAVVWPPGGYSHGPAQNSHRHASAPYQWSRRTSAWPASQLYSCTQRTHTRYGMGLSTTLTTPLILITHHFVVALSPSDSVPCPVRSEREKVRQHTH